MSDEVKLRAGWNYGKSPINENREIIFNMLAPATTEHHVTFGGTYRIATDMELSMSVVHAFNNLQQGPTYISDDGSNLGQIEMNQTSIGGSFAYKF